MIFDLDFLNLELKAALAGVVPAELFRHPVFQAIAFHESELDRPALDEGQFCAYFAAAAAGETSWGLETLFQRREQVRKLESLLCGRQQEISRMMDDWLSHFTSARLSDQIRCSLYVGTHDGGFKLSWEPNKIFINVASLSNVDCFLETLAHESYHARPKNREALRLIRRLEEENDYLGAVLYSAFEEGTADFIGNNGATTSNYPVFPLRSPEEGLLQMRQLLWDYQTGKQSGEVLYQAFRKTDCCYTAGVAIAAAIFQHYGIDGIDVWAVAFDQRKFYDLFRSTELGMDWPNLLF